MRELEATKMREGHGASAMAFFDSYSTTRQNRESYLPQAALKASTLSVFSQVNSGSSRPKWP